MKALLLTLLVLTTTQQSLAQSYEPQARQTAFQQLVHDTQLKLFKANCVPVPRDVEPTDVCAEDHLWGLGASGGWYCCERAPT